MSANVVSLFSRPRRVREWGRQEVAEFYRVRDILSKSGIALDTEQGFSDEGDPWFVFCRSDTGDVVAHFARIDDLYVIGIPALGDRVLRGLDFRSLIDAFLSGQPEVVVVPQSPDNVRRLVIHPNALMVAFVATILLLSDGLKSSALAAEPSGDRMAGSGSSGQLPYLNWTNYERVSNRDGGWEAERTLAIVAAIVMASIVGNDFNLLDKAGAALDGGRLMIIGSMSEQASLGEDVTARITSVAHAVDMATSASGFEVAHLGGTIQNPHAAPMEIELAKMLLTTSDVFTDIHGTDSAIEFNDPAAGPSIVDQALQFIASMAQSSPESVSQVYGLALSLIQDLTNAADDLPMSVAPTELLSLLNGVIQTASLIPEDVATNPSIYILDPGALLIEISGPSSIDTAALFIPESSAPMQVGPSAINASPAVSAPTTEPETVDSVPVASMSAPIIKHDSVAFMKAALSAFLEVAQGVDVVVDNDTIVFVDRSDRDGGAALQVGSVWNMQNDITIMIVGSTDTIDAYHESIAPIA